MSVQSRLELDVRRLRGERLRLAAAGFAASVVLGLVVGFGLKLGGVADAPLLIAVALVATSLGVVVPVLKDAGEAGTELGQLVIAAASIADFGAIILLLLFPSAALGMLRGARPTKEAVA